MGHGTNWTHDELMVAMNLYCKLPFGQLHYRNPLIVQIAEKLGRSPGSLAMKLCNLASLDPQQHARGIKGLNSTSKADRAIWDEFAANWEHMAIESETLLEALPVSVSAVVMQPTIRERPYISAPQETETVATTRVRIGQNFFRQMILASYNSTCCVSGNPIPQLLVASHILKWSDFPGQRMNPHNGLCLARTYDIAFEIGLICFDDEYRLLVSSSLQKHLPNNSLEKDFVSYRNRQMNLPDRFFPNLEFIKQHRETRFEGHPL